MQPPKVLKKKKISLHSEKQKTRHSDISRL